ncbi:hypothetical protein GCM10027589_05900 [Actinocorallia lasiicapitis]
MIQRPRRTGTLTIRNPSAPWPPSGRPASGGGVRATGNPPQPTGTPRPGHGAIYYNTAAHTKII